LDVGAWAARELARAKGTGKVSADRGSVVTTDASCQVRSLYMGDRHSGNAFWATNQVPSVSTV
jgi:hypothetical protein